MSKEITITLMRIHIYSFTEACMHVRAYAHTLKFACSSLHTKMCVYACVYFCLCACPCMCVCVCIGIDKSDSLECIQSYLHHNHSHARMHAYVMHVGVADK